MESSIAAADHTLLAFAQEMLALQEAERTRIAADLHDGLGQSFSAMKFCVEGLERSLASQGTGQSQDLLASLAARIQDAVDETRRITMNLHPRVLDDLGLLATISWFLREYQVIHPNINIEKRVLLMESDIPSHLRIALFRIIQEAFNNITKHASASNIYLSLEKIDGETHLTIEDNGIGFEPPVVAKRKSFDQGFGLITMLYRSALSGADFKIRSANAQGTTIQVAWPRARGELNGEAV